jgi:hypothetical protein
MPEAIQVRNARVHNLQGISLDIPRNRLVAFTGVSGSGKSSLVFDTLHTEAQRQLLETFSSFSRYRSLSRPDVDEINRRRSSSTKAPGRTLRPPSARRPRSSRTCGCCGDTGGEQMPSLLLLQRLPAGASHARGGQTYQVDTSLLLDRSLSLRTGAITHPDYKAAAGLTEIVNCASSTPTSR